MSTALAQHVVHPELWESVPADWDEVFGRVAPLAVELGFGNGEFIATLARERPDWNLLGFEISLSCVDRAAHRLARQGASHVRLGLVDGRFGLRELVPDGGAWAVYVHFPCPWPKARHAGRRLFDATFVGTLSSVLVTGGEVRLVTDVRAYAEEAAAEMERTGCFEVEGPEPLLDTGPDTRYELKWRRQGRPIWRVTARAMRSLPVHRIAGGEMPHARVEGRVDWDSVTRLDGLSERASHGGFTVREAYTADHGASALVRTFTTDEGFQQQFFVLVAHARKGTLVKLDGGTLPFRTPNVKRAVAAIAEALEEAA